MSVLSRWMNSLPVLWPARRVRAVPGRHEDATCTRHHPVMPSFATSLLSTLQDGGAGHPLDGDPDDRLEAIRHAMLDSLAGAGVVPSGQIQRRILFAYDAESLWYLRPELLQEIATLRGEATARRRIDRISALFAGLLPRAMHAGRPALAR